MKYSLRTLLVAMALFGFAVSRIKVSDAEGWPAIVTIDFFLYQIHARRYLCIGYDNGVKVNHRYGFHIVKRNGDPIMDRWPDGTMRWPDGTTTWPRVGRN